MARRDVDSEVLRELARSTGSARQQIEHRFNPTRSRVDSAPGGWDRGRWDGVPSFIRMELESLDREERELNARAAKIEIAAAINALPDGLPLAGWKFLMGLFAGPALFPSLLLPGAVTDLVAKVAEFSRTFAANSGKSPNLGDFGAWAAATIGGLGLLTGAAKGGGLAPGSTTTRFGGLVTVGGKALGEAEIVERAKGINQVYRNALGRPPTNAEYHAAMRSGKTVDEIREELGTVAGSRKIAGVAARLSESSAYRADVEALYGSVNVNPYPALGPTDGSVIVPTENDCVTFAGAMYLALGLSGTSIPGRGGGLVNRDPDSWAEGWREVEVPEPGSYVRVGGSHSAVYLGAIGDSFVVAESNYPTGSGPRIVVVDASGKVSGVWDPSMETPIGGQGEAAAAAIEKRYGSKAVFASHEAITD